MQRKSIRTAILSILITLLFVITSVSIFPQITLAEYTTSTAIELSNKGTELPEQGNFKETELLELETIEPTELEASSKDEDIPDCGECKSGGQDGYFIKRYNRRTKRIEKYCKECSLIE